MKNAIQLLQERISASTAFQKLTRTSIAIGFTFAFFLFTSNFALAQTSIPQVVSFSAVVRDANNQLLANTPVSLRLTFRRGGQTGPEVYCALHQGLTNANGFVSIQLNRNVLGTACNGAPATTFENIPWQEGGFWMEVEYQTVPNTPFVSLGLLELASSFYAFAAGTAEQVKGVQLQGAQNGQVLAYNQSSGKWEPTAATAGPQGVAGPAGSAGAAGATGPSGADGKTSLVKTSTEAAGINCNTGGIKIESGIDANGNSILETSEINTSLTRYICNGAVGQTGAAGTFQPGTNAGDMYYWNGSAWSIIPAGNQGQSLIFCNGKPTWGACLVTLTTTAVTSIGSFIASSGGNISNDGGGAVTARGVVWSTAQNPTIALTTKTNNGTGTGSFTSSITGLSPGTTYYVRAYATNSAGTAYGNQQTLTTLTSTISVDVDGNVYNTVAIGSREWMKENLKVSKYRNGDPIPSNLNDAAWGAATTGAYAIFNDNATNNTNFGKLYNWYVVADPRGLCPAGWHVSSDGDWKILESFLGMPANELDSIFDGDPFLRGSAQDIGGKLKAVSSLWPEVTGTETNVSGFSALPGGLRFSDGTYTGYENVGSWWTSTEDVISGNSWRRNLIGNSYGINRSPAQKTIGRSVRCVRD
jgi:uncharacterized protein (TIGR02145 family)